MSDELEATPTGIDRRTFMKSSAVVGGLVWAAPAMSTLGARAFAGTPLNLCPPGAGQPSDLKFLYTGKGCVGSTSPQFTDPALDDKIVFCQDFGNYPDGASGRTLRLKITGAGGPPVDESLEGLIPGTTTFFSPLGGGQAGANTIFEIYEVNPDGTEGQLVHRVGFHTSCSEPLRIGDNFGSFELIAGFEG